MYRCYLKVCNFKQSYIYYKSYMYYKQLKLNILILFEQNTYKNRLPCAIQYHLINHSF